MAAPIRIQQQRLLLTQVYGTFEGTPVKPLPRDEAGLGSGRKSHQRRYLWTDAFGVVALVAQARSATTTAARDAALQAAAALADETFETLGAPGALLGTHMTSWTTDDADYDAALALLAPNIGLRIGKSSANPSGKSDAGMDLDGQYFHYLDKALFASAVLAEEAGDNAGTRHALRAAAIILGVHKHFTVPGEGVHWKLNTNATPIRALGPPRPICDAIFGFIAYKRVSNALVALGQISRANQIAQAVEEMRVLAAKFASSTHWRASSDPLGWGLQCIEAHWLAPDDGGPRDRLVRELDEVSRWVLSPTHISLPFRLYGALIGANVLSSSSSSSSSLVPNATQEAAALTSDGALVSRELSCGIGSTPHSAINKAMLANVLDVSGWCRRDGEAPYSCF